MPFKSKAQQRFMFARHPGIAKRWEDKYGIPKGMPEHTSSQARKAALRRRLKRKGKHGHG